MEKVNEYCLKCGSQLTKHYVNPFSKRNTKYDLICWDCGRVYTTNGRVKQMLQNGSFINRGRHDIAI